MKFKNNKPKHNNKSKHIRHEAEPKIKNKINKKSKLEVKQDPQYDQQIQQNNEQEQITWKENLNENQEEDHQEGSEIVDNNIQQNEEDEADNQLDNQEQVEDVENVEQDLMAQNQRNLQEYQQQIGNRGVVYMSRIPPYMTPNFIRKLLQVYDVERIYLLPESQWSRNNRIKHGGKVGFNLQIKRWQRRQHLLQMVRKWFIKKVHSTAKISGIQNTSQNSNGTIQPKNSPTNKDQKNNAQDSKCNNNENYNNIIQIKSIKVNQQLEQQKVNQPKVKNLKILMVDHLDKQQHQEKIMIYKIDIFVNCHEILEQLTYLISIIRKIIKNQKTIKKRMVIEQEFDKAFFQSTFSNFVSEVLTRQIEANKIQMDLLRRFEGKTQCINFHLQIIKYCRISVDKIDNMLRDVKEYFQDLKINGVYDLFETMFRILVYDIKKISECYLRRFQTYRSNNSWDQKREKNNRKQTEEVQGELNVVCICRQKKREDIKKLEHLDFQIAGIEAKQNAIQDQMNFLISNLKDEKEQINKINPSSQKAILEEIQKFCQISKRAQTMFNNFFKNMFQDQKKNNFLQPQKFNEQIFFKLKSQIKTITRNKITKMQQMLNSLYRRREETHVQKIKRQVRKDSFKEFQLIKKNQKAARIKSKQHRKHLSDYSNQLGQSIENKEKGLRFQENFDNEQLVKQIQNLKKSNSILSCQLIELKQTVKRQQQQKSRMQKMNRQLQNLFKKRSHQLQSEKAELKWTVEKNTKQTIILASQKMEIQEKFHKSLRNTYRGNSNLKTCESQIDQQSQTDPPHHNVEQSDTFIFQHKPFMPLKSKMKKRTSTDAKDKTKLQEVQKAQKQLKEAISKIGQFLCEKDGEKVQEKYELDSLLKEQKYDQLILKLKQKLDQLFHQASHSKFLRQSKQGKQIKQKAQQQAKKYLLDKKPINNKKNFGLSSSSSSSKFNPAKSQSKQNKYTQIGIQTTDLNNQKEIKVTKRNHGRYHSIASSQRPYRDRNKMVTMMNLQNKLTATSRQAQGVRLNRNHIGYKTLMKEPQLKDKNMQGSGLISRFYRNSEIKLSNTGQISSHNLHAKKRNHLENALFQQLQFDNGLNDTSKKRQSYYKKMTNAKMKQYQKKNSLNDKNDKKQRDTIQQEEQGNQSSRMSVSSGQEREKITPNIENMKQEIINGLQHLTTRPQRKQSNLFKCW